MSDFFTKPIKLGGGWKSSEINLFSLFSLQALIFLLRYLILTEHLLLAGIAFHALPAVPH